MFIICTSLFAQDAHPSFKHYTVDDGLPSSEVYQVKQDSKGYIWFATGNGVSRFNGYEFENFSMKDGLPDNTVFEIYEDSFERIWFVPLSCKLSYYYKGKIYPFQYNDAVQKALLNAVKTSFCIDRNGTIFLGLHAQGIMEISKNGKITMHFSPNVNGQVDVMQPDSQTFVYSYYAKSARESFKDMYLRAVNFQTPMHHELISLTKIPPIYMGASGRIIRTKQGKIFVGIGKALLEFNEQNLASYKIENFSDRIVWVYSDLDGDLWVGTVQGGVFYIENGNFKGKRNFLDHLPVTGVLQDREGGFWFSIEGGGVYYAASKRMLVFDKSIGFSDDRIICAVTDGARVFSGTQNGCIEEVINDKKIHSYNINPLSPANEVSALFYDHRQKQLRVSGKLNSGYLRNGRYINDPAAFAFNSMVMDSAGNYWMACSSGVVKIENNQSIHIMNSAISKKYRRTNGIAQSMDDNILMIGAINGLWTYHKNNGTYRYLGYKNKLFQNRILDLDYFSPSFLVMGTKGAGLLLYDLEHEEVTQVNTSNGLCGDNVYAIYIASPEIWIATNKGLNKLVLERQHPLKYVVKSYTGINGLPSNEVNDVLKVGNKVWVAMNKGLAFFVPDSIDHFPVELPLYINKISINDKDTVLHPNYQLNYDQNNIKITFTGLGYKQAGKLSYRYMMLGLDKNWKYTKAREVQYTTLPANIYTFLLNVENADGTWSTNEASVHFRILLPFWKEWWFLTAVIALCTYVMFLLLRYRLKRIQQRKEKIEDLNKTLTSLRLKALRAQMNPHFTFNVMNSIQHFIASNNSEAANRYLSRFSRLIRLILNNSERTVVPLADEIKALELYLELEAMRFEERFEYRITVDKSIDTLEVEIPSMLIQPYVENSIKHGILNLKHTGCIKIDIQREDNIIKCLIEDNGVGRAESFFKNRNNHHKSFGTIITQERLAAINALNNSQLSERVTDLRDENGNATGTRVEIYIPLN